MSAIYIAQAPCGHYVGAISANRPWREVVHFLSTARLKGYIVHRQAAWGEIAFGCGCEGGIPAGASPPPTRARRRAWGSWRASAALLLLVLSVGAVAQDRDSAPPSSEADSKFLRLAGAESRSGATARQLPLYRLSQATLAGATAWDLYSTQRAIARGVAREANPILRGADGNVRVGLAVGLTVGWQVLQELAIRKWPELRKPLTWVNFGHAGVRVVSAAGGLR
jgi:hypothetical protein